MEYNRGMNRVAEYRKRAELTQRVLAERAGVLQPYIARLEAGEFVPSVLLAGKIAKALRATVEELFSDK